jgi:hypothetical protein
MGTLYQEQELMHFDILDTIVISTLQFFTTNIQ